MPTFLRLALIDGKVSARVRLVRAGVELDVAGSLQRTGKVHERVAVDFKWSVAVAGVDHRRRGAAEVTVEGLQVGRAAGVWDRTSRGDGQEKGKDCSGLHGGLYCFFLGFAEKVGVVQRDITGRVVKGVVEKDEG